jgi:plasmid segregation protein ParM
MHTSPTQLLLPVVRAIDVGYSLTKFTLDDGGRCRCFPSVTPLAPERELGVGRHSKRDTVVVPVGDLRYEVGPDAKLAQATVAVSSMADDFVLTDDYLALCRGALRYMRAECLDLLVVGLPVALFKQRRHELERRLIGCHDLAPGKTTEVRRVVAMAQPMGAFLSYAVPVQQRRQMLKQRNLIVDPGGRTFDWLMTQGLKPLERRRDSINKGMTDVLDAIARSIGEELHTQLADHDRDKIERALRKGESPHFFGQPRDIGKHIVAGERVVKEALAALRNQVQDGSDVDNIVLAGGGAFFFGPQIRRAYPKHRVLQVADPLYANVRGFLIAGQELLRAEARRGARKAQTEATVD